MREILIICILLINVRLINGGNQTYIEPRNDLYSYSISLTDILNKQIQLNKYVQNGTKETNQTNLVPVFNPNLYYSPITTSTEITTEKTTEKTTEFTIEMITEIFNTSKTIEEIATSLNTISYVNDSESTKTNDSKKVIIPAMPGIPIFEEPPEIKIHDPDEGPLDPFYHPSNETDYYPTTSMPDQQFIFMKRPEFVAEKGSLEEKYKQLLIDKEDDDITFPPGFDGQDFSNYTKTENIITMSTTKPENLNTTENYFQPQIPYPYPGYPYNPYVYGLPPFVSNYNPPYLPPPYPGYYQNSNNGKQLTEFKIEIPEIKPNAEEENIDPKYKMLPKSYAEYGAQIAQVSVDDKGSKDYTGGDSDSLEVFAPLELGPEEENIDKVVQNVSKKITLSIDDNDSKLNEFLKILNVNNDKITNKSEILDKSKKNKKRYPRIRNSSRKIRTRIPRIQRKKIRTLKRHPIVRNNNKRINRKSHKTLVSTNKTDNKFSKFIYKEKNKNKFGINYDFNKPNIYFPFEAIQRPGNIFLSTIKSSSLMSTIPTRNPSLIRRYNSRRMRARKKHNKPLVKKKLQTNHRVKNRHKKKKVKNPKSPKHKTQHSSPSRRSEVNKALINKTEWKQTARPKLLLRAKLRNSNQLKVDKKTDKKWWLSEQPIYCLEPIYVVNDCPNRKLTKRWSYNANDQRCYFYDDFCSHVKTNSFATSQECFLSCWRSKNDDKTQKSSIE